MNPTPPARHAVETERLKLVHLDPEFITEYLAGQVSRAEEIIGARLVHGFTADRWVLELRLRQMLDDPAQRPFLLRAVVLKEKNEVIGDVGFHERPEGEYLREYCERGLEIGYSINVAFRRRGFGQEAIMGMMRWAYLEHAVHSFFLSISPENAPSLALAQKLGFRVIASKIDEIDGLELVFRADADREVCWVRSRCFH